MTGNLSHFSESDNLLPPFPFSYRRGLRTCDALLPLPHHLQVPMDRGLWRRLVQLEFSATFDRVSHRGLLCKLRSIGVEGQFLSTVSKFLSNKRQRVHLDGKVGASVEVISSVPFRTIVVYIRYTTQSSSTLLEIILWAM